MSSGEGPIIMSGRKLAGEMQAKLAQEVTALHEKGVTPGLATILVGDDSPSATYIAMKHRACAEIGIRSIHTHLPASTPQEELMRDDRQHERRPGGRRHSRADSAAGRV